MSVMKLISAKRKADFTYGSLYLGDARELIKEIPDGYVDLIFTDPDFEDDLIFDLEPEFWRVLKSDAWLVFYWAIERLPQADRFKRFEYVWLIISEFKRSRTMSRLGRRNYMPILVFKKGKPKVHKALGDLLPAFDYPEIEFKCKKPKFFKPTLLNSTIIAIFTRRGDLILDPFTGLGSIPYACERGQRRWIAFEIDPETWRRAASFIGTGVVK